MPAKNKPPKKAKGLSHDVDETRDKTHPSKAREKVEANAKSGDPEIRRRWSGNS